MYTEKLAHFKNAKNLGGKAWEHAVMIDFAEQSEIEDCAMHCFHFQQLFELLFKHLLETKSKYGAYPRTHKLNKLLEQLSELSDFKTDIDKYEAHLTAITVCAEAYRYNFLIDCKVYRKDVAILTPLIDELMAFAVS
ncbi:MAG: HEPN domain-containing protein [Methylococcaceae bacterium]